MILKKYSWILLLSFSSLYAQEDMKEINAIKKNKNYLYAMGVSNQSVEEAANNAKDLIAIEIEQWLKEKAANDIAGYVAKSKESFAQIETQRGHLYRVFIYVKKKDVLPYYKEENMMKVDLVKKEDNRLERVEKERQVENVSFFTPTPREEEMLSINSFSSLNDYVNRGREYGEIIGVMKYRDMTSESIYYMFVFNQEKEIVAHFKVTNLKMVNMVTGNEESTSQYEGCGSICIQFKEN